METAVTRRPDKPPDLYKDFKRATVCHNILSNFREVQNYLQIEENLKIIVYKGRKTPKW